MKIKTLHLFKKIKKYSNFVKIFFFHTQKRQFTSTHQRSVLDALLYVQYLTRRVLKLLPLEFGHSHPDDV